MAHLQKIVDQHPIDVEPTYVTTASSSTMIDERIQIFFCTHNGEESMDVRGGHALRHSNYKGERLMRDDCM